MLLPDSITALIAALGRLPGVGPRSAERIALHLVQTDPATVKQLADTIFSPAKGSNFATSAVLSLNNPPAPTAPIGAGNLRSCVWLSVRWTF